MEFLPDDGFVEKKRRKTWVYIGKIHKNIQPWSFANKVPTKFHRHLPWTSPYSAGFKPDSYLSHDRLDVDVTVIVITLSKSVGTINADCIHRISIFNVHFQMTLTLLSVCLLVFPSVSLSFVCHSVCLCFCLPVCLSVWGLIQRRWSVSECYSTALICTVLASWLRHTCGNHSCWSPLVLSKGSIKGDTDSPHITQHSAERKQPNKTAPAMSGERPQLTAVSCKSVLFMSCQSYARSTDGNTDIR